LRWFSSVSSAPLETQIGGVAIFLFSGAAFLLVANQVRDLRWLQAMTWIFIGISALHVGGWLEYSVLGPIGSRLQLGATSNSMFWVWMTALAFAQALYNGKLHLIFRVALLLLVAAVVYVSFMLNAEWKSGYLPAMVALAAIIAARSWRVGLLVTLLAIVPAIQLATNAIATDEYSYSTRIDAWVILLAMAKVNPLLGFGPANYYWYTPLFPIRGYHINFNSHNQYVDILAQTGILGLAAFAWFAAEVGRLGWNLRNKAPEGFARAYVYGAIGGLVGMLASGVLVDWFLPFTYNIGLSGFRGSVIAWLFLGGLVSIEQMMRRDESSQIAGSEGETQHE
jgi:O-antigen ligase